MVDALLVADEGWVMGCRLMVDGSWWLFRLNSWTKFLDKVSGHKHESSQTRVLVWFSTLILLPIFHRTYVNYKYIYMYMTDVVLQMGLYFFFVILLHFRHTGTHRWVLKRWNHRFIFKRWFLLDNVIFR